MTNAGTRSKKSFSLTETNPSFNPDIYLDAIRNELGSYGFEMTVDQKQKSKTTAIQSAFIKGGTLIHLIKIGSITPPVSGVPKNEQLKIKIEFDTTPPPGAAYEVKYRLAPIPHSVRLYDRPSLFAGKLHALLCRNWKSRAKGRDFFDYLWYLSHDIPVNTVHFEARMRQSGHWKEAQPITKDDTLRLLKERFTLVDFNQIKADITPFIKNTNSLDLWNEDFFAAISADRLKFENFTEIYSSK
jgi:hypothetical protein